MKRKRRSGKGGKEKYGVEGRINKMEGKGKKSSPLIEGKIFLLPSSFY